MSAAAAANLAAERKAYYLDSLLVNHFTTQEEALFDAICEFIACWRRRHSRSDHHPTLDDLKGNDAVKASSTFFPESVGLQDWIDRRIGGEMVFEQGRRGLEIVKTTGDTERDIIKKTRRMDKSAAVAAAAGTSSSSSRRGTSSSGAGAAATTYLPKAMSADVGSHWAALDDATGDLSPPTTRERFSSADDTPRTSVTSTGTPHSGTPRSSVEGLFFAPRRSDRTSTKESTGDISPGSHGGELPSMRSRSFNFDARSFVPERVSSSISRRYDIDPQEIGVGGYGRVYAAKDRMFKDRRVAIKKLVRDLDEKVETLKHEVDILKELDHPSICKLFETYLQDDKVMFFVIEHLEGGDLCDFLMEEHHVEETMAAHIIQQAASAVRYAHGRGMAHRDLKPENVCFCSRDPRSNHRVKVIDWGLGKHFVTTRMKSNVGSGCFSAPEVLAPPSEDACYTSACDLWSLGVMAYVLLSGKPPFYGGPLQMLRRMQEERYPMGNQFWEGISVEAKDFIASLLRCDPEQRPSAESLLLHPWLARRAAPVDEDIMSQVLSNVEQFSHAPDFLSICVASVARQLDHRSLDNVYRVFCCLDSDSDGYVGLGELRAGFVHVFGEDSEEVAAVDETFSRLDLAHTGHISYTEFCAAGIGESSYTQEQVLWAAFKTFDLDDNGKITAEDMQQVLSSADVNQVWSESVCKDVADEVMQHIGSKDGSINFEEWLSLMRECASQHCEETPKRKGSNKSMVSEISHAESALPQEEGNEEEEEEEDEGEAVDLTSR